MRYKKRTFAEMMQALVKRVPAVGRALARNAKSYGSLDDSEWKMEGWRRCDAQHLRP